MNSTTQKRKLKIKYESSELLNPSKHHCLSTTEMDKENSLNEFNLKDLENMFDSDFEDIEEFNDKLDLSTFQRCIVVSLERDQNRDLILNLIKEKCLKEAKCICKGVWRNLNIVAGELLSIKANYSIELNCFVITSENGTIIRYPDLLISGTSVVGSLFCLRRGVLSDKFRGVDGGNKIMTIGSLVHELLQTVLKRKLETLHEIRSVSEEILNSRATIFLLYSSQMTLEDTRIEMNKFLPNIAGFIQRYIKGNVNIKDSPNTFSGQIDIIQDIEENVWIPKLGLKGKIDLTVKIRLKQNIKNIIQEMPLELKTGKASFSNEHNGQIMLYQMMLSELGRKVNSGLLLYLKDGIMKEIPLNKNVERDLFFLRNDLANYLSKKITKDKVLHGVIPEFPEPINNLRGCEKCPYNIICCSFLNNDKTISDKHPLKIASSSEIINHLTQEHIEYFIKWTSIISIEQEEFKKSNQLKFIWTTTPEKRCKRKLTIMNLIVSGKVVEEDNNYLHVLNYDTTKLTEDEKLQIDLTKTLIKIGDFIIISIKKRVAIATGKVQIISKNTVTLYLDRDLTKNYKNELFILDLYQSDSIMSMNSGNLGTLLENCETSNRLRRIIIDKIVPTFIKTVPKLIATYGGPILLKLNTLQRKAILKAITAQDYLLLKGLPGTGKTQTLVALIQILHLIGKSVLITSHTHSAIDNLLIRLKQEKIPFMRLGALARMNPLLRPFSEAILTENCKSPAQLEIVYKKFKIVGVTCQGSSHVMLSQQNFDVCVVDESTQVFQPSLIRPLLYANKFILVGDPDQLPPIIKSMDARNLGADESLFARLDSEEATFSLTMQYRMNKTITNLANKLTYKGELKCATAEVANATLNIPKPEIITEYFNAEKWLIKTLSKHVDQSVILLDTGNVYQKSLDFSESQKNDRSLIITSTQLDEQNNFNERERVNVNYCETALALYIINALIKAGVKGDSIGMIAPYRVQVENLKEIILKYQNINSDEFNDDCAIEVNTVDQYQGRDKEVIIYSCTKSDNPVNNQTQEINNKESEILEDYRRLTVAITRSKHKLIIIGDVETLQKYTPFNNLFESLNSICKIILIDGRLGFTWNGILIFLEGTLDKENDVINKSLL